MHDALAVDVAQTLDNLSKYTLQFPRSAVGGVEEITQCPILDREQQLAASCQENQ